MIRPRKARGAARVGAPALLLTVVLSLCFVLVSYNLFSFAIRRHRRVVNDAVPGSPSDPVDVRAADHHEQIDAAGPPFHVAVTAEDTPYSRWQCRIMYYWYKRVRAAPGSAMGGFTRILHSGQPDKLMTEIPTVVVNPLPPGLDRGYVVLNRPWAFVQWLKKETIEEDYILMAEPDHIFVNPLPNLARGSQPAGYPFFYMEPTAFEKVLLRKFYPEEKGPVTDIDPIGNSPAIIHKALLGEIAPTWMNVSVRMKSDPETDRTFGWILEMYAYAVASALHGVKHILREDFMVQPPFDVRDGKTFIIHYTYACDYTAKGELLEGKIGWWRFDKRFYLNGPPPRNLSLPPPGVPQSLVTMVKMINEAIDNIPDWDNGR